MATGGSRRLSGSSKMINSSGTDPLVKDKEAIKKLTPILIKFLSEVPYNCTDMSFDFKRSLTQLRNLPTARLVREIYNFFFLELLGVALEKKVVTEIVLDHLKDLDYPFVIPKSSITSPNNSSSWPYNFAAFIYLKDLYVGFGLFEGCEDTESFAQKTLGFDNEEENINVFDDEFVKSFAVQTNAFEDVVELKRMTNILASNDLEFKVLHSEVKDLRNAKKALEDELWKKQSKFADLFGSVEEFEGILKSVKDKETVLARVREQIDSMEKEETDRILACRRVQDKIQAMRDDCKMKFKLHFPEYCDKICDLIADKETQLSETTNELKLDLGRKMKAVLQKKTELKELHGVKETSVFRLRHELETLREDCEVLQSRVDKIRENIDKWYKLMDRSEALIKKFTDQRDKLIQDLQRDYKAGKNWFQQQQSQLDQFAVLIKELDPYAGTNADAAGSNKENKQGKKKNKRGSKSK